jgi:hypothetical protein
MIHQTFGFLNSIDMSEQSIIPWGAPGSPCNSAYPRVATVLADWVDPAWIDESNTK